MNESDGPVPALLSLTASPPFSVVQDTTPPTATIYLPYGAERSSKGSSVTDFGFASQHKDSFGLMDYNARYYSPLLSRFISPDGIVPEPTSSGGFNRYRYTRNNPTTKT